jgi:dissimilatory sulfite reductase (desulfoviridin) alpha/beta subunit
MEQPREVETLACRAATGCRNSVGDVTQALERLQEVLERVDAPGLLRGKAGQRQGPLLAHHRFKVSVSGCPNSCSQPQIADFGLSAQLRPELDQALCIGCGACVEACREGAIVMPAGTAELDRDACVSCGACVRACPTEALTGTAGWRVMAGGRLGRHPRLAHVLAEGAGLDEAAALLEELLRVWRDHGRPGERVGLTLERLAGEEAPATVLVS